MADWVKSLSLVLHYLYYLFSILTAMFVCVSARVYLCEYLDMLPEGLSWLQFKRVGFALCLRSRLTMLVCKRWNKHPHPFTLDPGQMKTLLGLHYLHLFSNQYKNKNPFHSRLLMFSEDHPIKSYRRYGSYPHFYCYGADVDMKM